MGKDMDRDIAEKLVKLIDDCSTLLSTIYTNNFVPYIINQPTNQTAAPGGTATFHVDAGNVKSYQWQYSTPSHPEWRNSSAAMATTDTYTLTIAQSTYANSYRCAITGKDNSVIYTNAVQVIAPEPEPES